MTTQFTLVIIKGITTDGKTFRPSDWSERLAGVMAQFGPDDTNAHRHGQHLAYSPWCVPTVTDGAKSVTLNPILRVQFPMAWDFVMHFARDNDLQILHV